MRVGERGSDMGCFPQTSLPYKLDLSSPFFRAQLGLRRFPHLLGKPPSERNNLMKQIFRARWNLLILILLVAGITAIPSFAQQLDYPQTRKGDQVDDYHGTKVADPYRWLEDDNSAETAKWVEAENKVTFGYLEKIPYREQVKQRLEQLFNYPKYSAPVRKGELLFYTKNNGLQNQNVVYTQKGLDGPPEMLLDPNKFSADGTTRLGLLNVSQDGKYAAYGASIGGSDWQEVRVLEVATKKELTDDLKWLKASKVSWAGNGFFYSRYDEPEKGHELSSK